MVASSVDVVPTTEEILEAVRSVQEDAIEFLRSIVSIDSTLEKGEGNVQNAIFEHMVRVLGLGASSSSSNSRPSFEVTRHPVRLDDIRDRRGFSPVDWAYDDEQKFKKLCSWSSFNFFQLLSTSEKLQWPHDPSSSKSLRS